MRLQQDISSLEESADTMLTKAETKHVIKCNRSQQFASYCERTRSSADADSRLDAFSGQSRSTNMVPFHMLHIVSYCAIVTLSLRRAVFTIFVFKKFHDLEMGVKGHSRSLRVVSFDRLCMVSY